MPQAIHISPIDNVVVALHPIAKGTLMNFSEDTTIIEKRLIINFIIKFLMVLDM